MKSMYYVPALLAGMLLSSSDALAETQTQTFTTSVPSLVLDREFQPGSFDYDETSAPITGIPKFDPALGTLTDVIIDFTWDFYTDYFIYAEGILDPGVPHEASAFLDQTGVGINFMRSDGGAGGAMYFEEGVGVGCFGEPGDGFACADGYGYEESAFVNDFSIFGFTDVVGTGSLDIFTVDIFFSGPSFDLNNVGTAYLNAVIDVFGGDFSITYVYDDGVSEPDSDSDGVVDAIDNCLAVANADQIDTNGDGIGNACDLDFNNDCVTNFVDFATLVNAFGPVNGTEDLDVNADGVINFLDVSVYTQYHLLPPGPSANGCN